MLNLGKTEVTKITEIDKRSDRTFIRDDEGSTYDLDEIHLETRNIAKGDYIVVSPHGTVLSNKEIIVDGYLQELGLKYGE